MKIKTKLIELKACEEAIEWAADMNWETAYNTCHRGDWMLWMFHKTNPDDIQRLTLAKGHCANTVRHLMIDTRSIAAVDAAIAFGQGKISKKDLAMVAAWAEGAAEAEEAAEAAEAAKIKNQKLTADICRKYLPIEIWNL